MQKPAAAAAERREGCRYDSSAQQRPLPSPPSGRKTQGCTETKSQSNSRMKNKKLFKRMRVASHALPTHPRQDLTGSGRGRGHTCTLAWRSAGGVSTAFLQPLQQDAGAITDLSWLICGHTAPSYLHPRPIQQWPRPLSRGPQMSLSQRLVV